MVIEFIIIQLPVVLLIVKVMEWSGNYLVLVFFLTTALVKVLLMYVHPLLISPLFSHYDELGEWADGLRAAIKEEVQAVGLNPDKVRLETSFEYDVHANASTSLG